MAATHRIRRLAQRGATLVVAAAVTGTTIVGASGIALAVPTKHRTPAPVNFTNSVPNPTNQTSATFTWAAPSGTTYTQQRCKLDAAAYATCTSGQTYSGLKDGSHTFSLNVKAGSKKAVTVTKTWTVDTQAPPSPVLSQPATPTSSTAVSISISESDTSATLTCALDTPTPSACTTRSTFAMSGLTDGSHTLVVAATDAAGNSSSSSVSWVVDTTAPAAVIVTPPASPTNDPTAQVTFTDSDPTVHHYGCALNGNAQVNPCASPWTPNAAPVQGLNTVVVTAYDAIGNANAAGNASWIFDSTAPDAPFIIDGPGSPTNQVSASIDFSDTDPTSTFQCRLDSSSAAAWSACTSPWTNGTDLADGAHTFEVRALDPAGNVSSATAFGPWTVDHTLVFEPVTFLAGPADPSNDTNPSFDFDVSDTNSLNPSFTCSLDAAVATACDSSTNPVAVDLTTAAEGLHTFTVVAVYSGGSSAPATYSWHLDKTAPAAPVVGAVPALSRQAFVTFTDASSDVSTFACSINGGAPVHCTSPLVVSGAGTYPGGVVVTATDLAGNVSDPSVASNGFTVKPATTAPTFAGSAASFTTHSVALTVSSTDAGDTLACSLDGATATDCSGGTWSATVADGSHTVTATATDVLGNKASADWHFTVNTSTTPPTTTPPTTTPPTVVLGSSAVRPAATWSTVRNARALGRSYVVERAAGASVKVAFRGRTITWYGVAGPDMGLARVFVDGRSKGVINSYAATRGFRAAHTITNLRKGAHVLRIVVLGKKGNRHAKDALVALDGVRVGSRTITSPKASYSWRAVHVGLVSGVVSDVRGAALTATFTGTGVSWTDVAGPKAGRLLVYVDGVSHGVIDDRAVAVGTAGHALTGLANGTHVLRLVVASRVSRGAPVTVLGISS